MPVMAAARAHRMCRMCSVNVSVQVMVVFTQDMQDVQCEWKCLSDGGFLGIISMSITETNTEH